MDSNHDTIINTGDGYYIPRKDNPAEMLEYKQYIAQETARAYIELDKVKPMWIAYERMEKNGGKQQNEGSRQHNPHHDKDVWDHTIAVIESITPCLLYTS